MSRLTARRIASLPVDLDAFVESYIEAALWTEYDGADDNGGAPLEGNYDAGDIPARVRRAIRAECADFLEYATDLDNAHHVAAHVLADIGPARAGHDFLLTRNRHGGGYWDRGLGVDGDSLTRSAHAFGSVSFYVKRGRVYQA